MPSTTWTLYSNNEEVWDSMLKDCSRAKESIDLEQYIFTSDEFGRKFIDICSERANAGVKVRFLWDAAGSFSFFGSNVVAELKAKGIQVIFWKTLIPSYFKVQNFRSWYLRNHRRTLVIDDEIGYTGSMSVDDRMRSWRDTNVRLEGKVVREMSNAFDRMWSRALHTRPLPPRIYARDSEFRYMTNYPAPGRRHIYTNIIENIRKAEKNVYITMPYFVPTYRLVQSIKLAAERGVLVKIIIPEKSDYYSVDLGARSYFNTLLESGVRIFLYSGNMIHSKAITIDNEWATVGSLNLDRASLLYNFEANIVSTDHEFADELAKHFVNDIRDSKEVTLNEWRNRFFLEKIPEILIRLVREFL